MTKISVAPNIVAMRELISAYSHGAESPIYQQRLEEATTVLGVKASLLQILCENWLTLIKDEIAVSTAVETDDAKLSFMGMVNGLTINQRVCAHLKNEFATPIRNEAEALLWVNLKAFERFAQKVQGLDSLAKQTPLCLLTMILGFATQAVKDEYADNLPKLKKHLISYLQYVVDVLQKNLQCQLPRPSCLILVFRSLKVGFGCPPYLSLGAKYGTYTQRADHYAQTSHHARAI